MTYFDQTSENDGLSRWSNITSRFPHVGRSRHPRVPQQRHGGRALDDTVLERVASGSMAQMKSATVDGWDMMV